MSNLKKCFLFTGVIVALSASWSFAQYAESVTFLGAWYATISICLGLGGGMILVAVLID